MGRPVGQHVGHEFALGLDGHLLDTILVSVMRHELDSAVGGRLSDTILVSFMHHALDSKLAAHGFGAGQLHAPRILFRAGWAPV